MHCTGRKQLTHLITCWLPHMICYFSAYFFCHLFWRCHTACNGSMLNAVQAHAARGPACTSCRAHTVLMVGLDCYTSMKFQTLMHTHLCVSTKIWERENSKSNGPRDQTHVHTRDFLRRWAPPFSTTIQLFITQFNTQWTIVWLLESSAWSWDYLKMNSLEKCTTHTWVVVIVE